MKIIFDYNRTIFDPETSQLYPGVFGLLGKLSQKHDLFLISRDEPGRREKFEDLGIRQYFKQVIFNNNKNVAMFVSLVGDDKNVLVVGDRLQSEIKLGNDLGLITVRIKQGKFSSELSASQAEEPRHVIDQISDLTKVIHLYEK